MNEFIHVTMANSFPLTVLVFAIATIVVMAAIALVSGTVAWLLGARGGMTAFLTSAVLTWFIMAVLPWLVFAYWWP